ncbi:putative NTP binding protein (contains STAS domain) [Methylophaga frappieri]|jgi:phospholipid transport system transporter-binding protein|uniref:Putative NTP binding protein (Contains STAS domain) n=1 Tax=Methylophaga frappieri (strain ATCC BAA-2434 / DSM 25690 / JAM7) TaxID=754477 RepID=I1YIP7_METFJ|nr:STAS domain-containing protein [Methylophaga frappieri]AFJ02790.1 putative NTP binding protein (contains STAS domain) [Methylophaga frappieri]
MTVSLDDATQRLIVSDVLTFETVAQNLAQSEPLIAELTTINVDLENVEHSDSAGLALLIQWLRMAKQQDKAIYFSNLPTQMQAMAKASGLETLLPQESL